VLVAAPAALLIGATAGGYDRLGQRGSDGQDFGRSPGPGRRVRARAGFPDRDGASDDHDHDQFDGPDGSTDDENS
jgi:hypothetical protein